MIKKVNEYKNMPIGQNGRPGSRLRRDDSKIRSTSRADEEEDYEEGFDDVRDDDNGIDEMERLR